MYDHQPAQNKMNGIKKKNSKEDRKREKRDKKLN